MEKLELVPVRTRILTPADNIVDAIETYGKDLIGPDDVVSVAESVVAITQGRMVRPEEMNPCFLARVLCRFIPQKASLSSIYGMQLAMDAAGKWRIAFWLFVGMLAKLVGKSGVFYAMSGEQTRLIDDVTGTMPPFDKHIVLGPEDPEGVSQAIKERLGCYGAVVADVNDLKRSYVLGGSSGVDLRKVEKMLIDNPFGNASQKTPIVVIKNYAKIAAHYRV